MHPIDPGLTEETPLLASPTSLTGITIYVYLVACISAVGGFLFGYDTGIISGAMIFVKTDFNLSELWQEAIVSVTLMTAWMFSIISGSLTDRLGRKPIILVSSIIFLVGSLLMSFAHNKEFLLAGRLVVGAGVGLASMTVPMYIAEVAPSAIRGQLVMINMLCITGGQFLANLIAFGFSHVGKSGWRYMLGFAAAPAFLQFIAFLAMPESPRWLVSKGKYDEAKQVLRRVRPKDEDIEQEFLRIRQSCVQSKQELDTLEQSGDFSQSSTFSRILANQPVRRAMIIGCLLQFSQQFTGINTVMYYTATIFELSGIREKKLTLLMSSATAFVNFLFTMLGYVLVERLGRRRLMLFSMLGTVLSLSLLGSGFLFAFVNSPMVTNRSNSTIDSPCSTISECSYCTRNPDCGFCFSQDSTRNAPTSASCLRVDPNDHTRPKTKECRDPSGKQAIWAYEWCPSIYAWVTLIGLVLYLIAFAPGMGPMPWIINSEIYPLWARSFCQSAATSVNWLSNLITSMTFLSLARWITKQGVFYLYGGITLIGLIFFTFVLPETRGKTLEELETLFASTKWLEQRRLTPQKRHQAETRQDVD